MEKVRHTWAKKPNEPGFTDVSICRVCGLIRKTTRGAYPHKFVSIYISPGSNKITSRTNCKPLKDAKPNPTSGIQSEFGHLDPNPNFLKPRDGGSLGEHDARGILGSQIRLSLRSRISEEV